jgi:hypothetical protein
MYKFVYGCTNSVSLKFKLNFAWFDNIFQFRFNEKSDS